MPADVKWPTFIVYGVAIIGSVYGGGIPFIFMNKGMHVYKARMTTMIIIAFFPLAVLFTQDSRECGALRRNGDVHGCGCNLYRCSCAPGVVCEPVHDSIRHVSQKGSGFRYRHRRYGRRNRRCVCSIAGRQIDRCFHHSTPDGVYDYVCNLRVVVYKCMGHHEITGSPS